MKKCILCILFVIPIFIVSQENQNFWTTIDKDNKIGFLYLQKGYPANASIIFEKTNRKIEKFLSKHNPKNEYQIFLIASAYSGYGKSLIDIDRTKYGIKLRLKACDIAEKFYKKRKSILFSQILSNTGSTYAVAVQGKKQKVKRMTEKSLVYYKRALDMQDALGVAQDIPKEYAKTLNGIGAAYERYGDHCAKNEKQIYENYSKASKYYEQSRSLKISILKGKYSDSLARTEINLANIYIKMSIFEKSYLGKAKERIFQTLHNMQLHLPNKQSYVYEQAYICKVDVLIKMKKYNDAFLCATLLQKRQKSFIESNIWGGATLHKQRMWREDLKLSSDAILSILSSGNISKKNIKEAFNHCVYNKSVINKILRNEKSILETQRYKNPDSQISKLWENYKTIISNISKETYSSSKKAATFYTQLKQRSFQLERLVSQNLKELYQNFPKLDVDLLKLQQTLGEKTIFLEWVEFDDWNNHNEKSLGCFVVAHNDIYFVKVSTSQKQIYDFISNICEQIKKDLVTFKTRWNQAVVTKQDPHEVLKSLKEMEQQLWRHLLGLKNILWQPINNIASRVENIVIAPCGDLHLIPWGILPLESEKKYAIQQYNFAYCSSALSFFDTSTNRVETKGIVCIGDPEIVQRTDNKQELSLRNIRNSLNWVNCNHFHEELQNALDNSNGIFSKEGELKRGKEATKTVFKNIAHKADILHIVSHATMIKLSDKKKIMEKFPLLNDPFLNSLLRASILFSDGQGKIAYLTALEISTLNLSSVQCVIISCCSTGDIIAEDAIGFAGFKWAFEQAGAKRTISNLWDVLDKESSIIIRGFYKEYQNGNHMFLH